MTFPCADRKTRTQLVCARCWQAHLFLFQPKPYNIHGLLTKRDSHLKIDEFQSLTTILRQQTREAQTRSAAIEPLRTLAHYVHAQVKTAFQR